MDVTDEMRLKQDCGFDLVHSIALWLFPLLEGKPAAILWSIVWRDPFGKQLNSLAKSQGRAEEALSPMSHEEMNADIQVSLEVYLPQKSLQIKLQPCERTWCRNAQLSHAWIPTPWSCEIISVKFLCFGVVGVRAIDN